MSSKLQLSSTIIAVKIFVVLAGYILSFSFFLYSILFVLLSIKITALAERLGSISSAKTKEKFANSKTNNVKIIDIILNLFFIEILLKLFINNISYFVKKFNKIKKEGIKIRNLKTKQAIIIIISLVCVIGIYCYIDNKQTKVDIIQTNEELENNIENQNDESNTKTEDKEELKELIKVHVSGAVNNPGIIELELDSRINDAIEMAGGLTQDASIDQINLAYILEDGMKIHIPTKTEIEKQEIVQTVTENTRGKYYC